MPRKYERKITAPKRAAWSEEQLLEAIQKVEAGEISKREAHRRYNVPPRTLMRRMTTGKLKKRGLGPEGVLGSDNEKRLVLHIQRLSAAGFASDRKTVRNLAYQFAKKLNIKHKFSETKEEAGSAWLKSFLERNPELSVRQAEGLSLSRAHGMNREDVRQFFDLLEKVMTEHDLLDKPSHIYNMDETGVQLINKPGKVITKKGSKDVHVLTSKERGENVTVIACCSADGKYIPPTLILKGVNRKPEFSDGLPGGSKVYMNRKSSFINSELFLRWLKEQFIPHKPSGKCLLILDGHTSHSTDIEMLELADSNNIIILCLPSHCTQALQPLDRSFFRPFKIYFNQEAQLWMKNHSSRNLTRYQAGELIGKAWLRSASVAIAVNGFKATGIHPLDPNAVPDHFFSMLESSEVALNDQAPIPRATTSESNAIHELQYDQTPTVSRVTPETNAFQEPQHNQMPTVPRAITPEPLPIQEPSSSSSSNKTPSCNAKFTPSKFLHELFSVPLVPVPFNKKRKQGASVLNSKQNIQDKKNKVKGKSKISKKADSSDEWSESDEEPLPKKGKATKGKEYFCVECFESYEKTTRRDDWLQCIKCFQWLHESCTMYTEKCNACSRAELRKKNYKLL